MQVRNRGICRLHTSVAPLAAAMLMSWGTAALAAQGAGAQIRQLQDETRERISPRPGDLPGSALPESPAAAQASTTRMYVRGFLVNGVTRFSQDEIAKVLSPFVGREQDTKGLHDAADALNRHYRKAGYFAAKVYIPPQEAEDTVRLDVYEGYLDGRAFEIENKGRRVKGEQVLRILEANIPRDEPLNRHHVERALLIAEDLPGITTSSKLYPGDTVGAARLRTTLADLPLFSGNVDVDNFGARATGQTRLGTTLYLNSPTGWGDQAVARLVTAGRRSNYAYLTYLVPVSPYGTRVGASVDYFGYDSHDVGQFGESEGHASDLRLYFTHPILRSRHNNVNLRADASHLSVNDRNSLGSTADRNIDSLTLALHGDTDHAFVATGLTVYDASITAGNVDLRGSDALRTQDETTARTAGFFSRVNAGVSRIQGITNRWSLFGRVAGQLASGNLDSTQKFYLGGATSVAGYPLGEAGGDRGADAHAEIRYDFLPPWNGTLQTALFAERGWIRVHKAPWPGWQGNNPIIQNSARLTSWGVSTHMTVGSAWVGRLILARQVGSNVFRDPATDTASDGRSNSYRAWFQAIHYF